MSSIAGSDKSMERKAFIRSCFYVAKQVKYKLSKEEVYCYNIGYTKDEEAVSMRFQEKCPEIAGTELWKIFEKKAGDDHEFVAAVGEICYDGVILSKDVIRFFPTFTLHDGTHLAGVCKWMIRLLGDKKDDLTVEEAAMLVMVACCHDIGMSVSDDQRKELEAELATGDYTEEWLEYFRKYPGDEVAYYESHTVTEEMLRKYIRENHSRRISEQLTHEWPDALIQRGIHRETLIRVCESHGESLSELIDLIPLADCDLNMCVVVLRLADLLDYDAARAPERLFHHLGLDHPETAEQRFSQEKWKENSSGHFGEIRDRCIPYIACFKDPQTEHEVKEYLAWLKSELLLCNEFLSRFSKRWQSLELPRSVDDKNKNNIVRSGYEAGDFHLTMDQDRILELLTGENLYSDPGVFVRELLQNAIDAVLTRRRLDPGFGEKDGKIVVHTWMDDEGYGWFRIEDDGIGMDEHIVKDYFLKVGRSYYTSDEYKAAMIHKVRDTNFTPTSRFGIGILSCFMSDPDNNRLEVVTRRYSPGTGTRNPVYRLDVTGLHGYYFLTKVTKGYPGQPMHRPPGADGMDDGYLHRVGTTICVRVNMYRVGGPRAVKDLMDKYVCFPEVPVEFHGPEGTYTYPTQQELMDLVHSMNPDGPGAEPKEYVHPITDEMFDELKREMTFVKWASSERPTLVLQYYPLDWLSGSENISGVDVRIGLRAGVIEKENSLYQGENYSVHVQLNGEIKACSVNKKLILSFDTDNLWTLGRAINSSYDKIDLKISYDYFLLMIEEKECQLLKYIKIFNRYPYNKKICTNTAYNGVLADAMDLLGSETASNFLHTIIILLRSENCPEMTLDRNIIKALQPETACTLVRISQRLPSLYHRTAEYAPRALHYRNFVLITSKEFWKILDKYPQWEEEILIQCNNLNIGSVFLSDLSGKIHKSHKVGIYDFEDSIHGYFYLAALKRRFDVWKSFSGKKKCFVTLKNIDTDMEDEKFPPSLFFIPAEESSVLGYASNRVVNSYNRNHIFSQWLIKFRKELQEKAPNTYNNILVIMITEKKSEVIIREINNVLNRLKQICGNPFGITNEIYLKDTDVF